MGLAARVYPLWGPSRREPFSVPSVLRPVMNAATALGLATAGVGLAGYVLGVWTPYPGRALSLPLMMVGVTLLAIRRVFDPEGDG